MMQAGAQWHREPWRVLRQEVVAGITLAAEGQMGAGVQGGIKKPRAPTGGREKPRI